VSAVLYAIDVGTTSLKGIAFDESRPVLTRAEAFYPLITTRPG
jgi:sugar (pentulose or hexulose) kinase